MNVKMEKPHKIGTILSIKNISYTALFLNLASIILGLVYLGTISSYSIIWDIAGIVYLITLFGNALLVYITAIRVNKTSKIGNRLSLLGYFFLAFMILGMLGMFGGNFLYSVIYTNNSILAYGLIYGSYFGLLIFGALLAYLNLRNLYQTAVWDATQVKVTSLRRKIFKIFLMSLCYLVLAVGIYFVCLTLFGAAMGGLRLGVVHGGIGMFVAQLDLFFVFINLGATIILLKLRGKSRGKSYYGVMILGLVISGIFMAPLCLTPSSVTSANESFTDAFGLNWPASIPADVENQYFLHTPFSVPEYFLGMPTANWRVIQDVQFYDAEGIRLYFDVYMPEHPSAELPGKNSTIIRIHGGGWVMGDKGLANMMQMNKYFASQGYIVFDIQYGLSNSSGTPVILPTPSYVLGNFSVNDMARHIGNFTQYLESHAGLYGANLSSVFISGGSAGGHLTCLTALAIASGNYTDIFGTQLKIKGYVPYYPANGHSDQLGVPGSPEFVSPDDYLINETSPPCLIFQGTQDGLVHPSISQHLKDNYEAVGNPDCALILLPLAGHAGDLYFTGYYNQVFLYYMERFLYLCVNNYF